ncbi:MAG: DUF1553 domain-containing protein, partial [Planctomycetales bacterium]|nr:DUF1553 domain-containing protein [Planctomycetales bacterium]
VDRLLSSETFTDYWTYRLAGWLRLRAPGGDTLAADAIHRWLRQQIADDVGLDEIARRLLTAMGDTHSVGPAVFHRLAGDPREAAELASETLLGIRLRCVNCHDHPLDRWTQDDYHGLAALFARIERGRIVRRLDRGDVIHPVTQQPALPRTPGGEPLDAETAGPEPFADWIVAADNPYFAKTQVNRVWQAMMGRGLIEPFDDVRDTNPPTHPRLLDSLAEDFRRDGYRLRPTIRAIALSATYRRSSRPHHGNGFDERFYSHALERPMTAEIYLDAICDVTGVREMFDAQANDVRAVQLASPNVASTALDILGRCSREQSCESGSSNGGGMAAQLHLLNGELLNRRLLDEQGWLHTQLDRDLPGVVEATYLRCFGREPADRERAFWVNELAGADGRRPSPEKLADFFWSILVSREFATNH